MKKVGRGKARRRPLRERRGPGVYVRMGNVTVDLYGTRSAKANGGGGCIRVPALPSRIRENTRGGGNPKARHPSGLQVTKPPNNAHTLHPESKSNTVASVRPLCFRFLKG